MYTMGIDVGSSSSKALILRDGRVETNCSFEVLIHLQRDALSAEVASVLFP